MRVKSGSIALVVLGCLAASSFPTSCGVNPMVAILTLARYQGRRIAAEWARYA